MQTAGIDPLTRTCPDQRFSPDCSRPTQFTVQSLTPVQKMLLIEHEYFATSCYERVILPSVIVFCLAKKDGNVLQFCDQRTGDSVYFNILVGESFSYPCYGYLINPN